MVIELRWLTSKQLTQTLLDAERARRSMELRGQGEVRVDAMEIREHKGTNMLCYGVHRG